MIAHAVIRRKAEDTAWCGTVQHFSVECHIPNARGGVERLASTSSIEMELLSRGVGAEQSD